MATFQTYFENWFKARMKREDLYRRLDEITTAVAVEKQVETDNLKAMAAILHGKYGKSPAQMVYHYQGMAFVMERDQSVGTLSIAPVKTMIDEDQPTIIEGP